MANTKSSSKKEQVKNPTPYVNYFLSLLLVLAGAAVLLYAAFSRFDFRIYAVSKTSSSKQIQAKPMKVYIPNLGRVLSVSEGEVRGSNWIISQTGVSYLTTSAEPGTTGNSIIYGHNTIGVLGGLWRVHEGDSIYVIMDNGQFYKYQVFERKEIDPSQVDILSQTPDSRLTIYTCSGFLDSARFVVVSKLATT